MTMATPFTRILTLLNPARGYDRALMRGMARYNQERGAVQFFHPPPFWAGRQSFDPFAAVRKNQIDGIIMIESSETAALADLGLPLVVSPYRVRRIHRACNLLTAHEAIGEAAATHLHACGFRHFAYCGDPAMFWSNDREKGFRRKLHNLGHSVETGPSQNRDALLAWLTALPKPIGVMSCADENGRELVELCLAHGIRVPDEIGIIGVDNDRLLCSLAPVPLSSVGTTAEQCGYAAVARIVQMQSEGRTRIKPDIIVEPSHVAARVSTDCINSEDTALVKAIRFIRENARTPVSVEDTARAAGLSRRVLEQRFRKSFGSSVYEEIRRERINRFAERLRESTSSISDIADQLGFSSTDHVARYFKTATGLTPRAYRAKYMNLEGF